MRLAAQHSAQLAQQMPACDAAASTVAAAALWLTGRQQISQCCSNQQAADRHITRSSTVLAFGHAWQGMHASFLPCGTAVVRCGPAGVRPAAVLTSHSLSSYTHAHTCYTYTRLDGMHPPSVTTSSGGGPQFWLCTVPPHAGRGQPAAIAALQGTGPGEAHVLRLHSPSKGVLCSLQQLSSQHAKTIQQHKRQHMQHTLCATGCMHAPPPIPQQQSTRRPPPRHFNARLQCLCVWPAFRRPAHQVSSHVSAMRVSTKTESAARAALVPTYSRRAPPAPGACRCQR